jgi:hypothetical protein
MRGYAASPPPHARDSTTMKPPRRRIDRRVYRTLAVCAFLALPSVCGAAKAAYSLDLVGIKSGTGTRENGFIRLRSTRLIRADLCSILYVWNSLYGLGECGHGDTISASQSVKRASRSIHRTDA